MKAAGPFRPQSLRWVAPIAAVLVTVTGCRSVGPATVRRDRFNYNAAITQSRNEQLLLNMVRLRYGEAPVFLDVASVISQYSLEGEASLGTGLNNSFVGDNALNVGGSARWTDRPTITYAPLSGQEFTLSVLTPVRPAAVFALLQSGWSVETVLGLTVRSINGVLEQDPVTGEWNPEFSKVMAALDRLQTSGAVGLRTRPQTGELPSTLVFRDVELDTESAGAIQFLRGALRLEQGIDEYEVVFGLIPDSPDEIAVLTNSLLEIMIDLGEYFEVPAEHVASGWTGPTAVPSDPGTAGGRPIIVVRASEEEPEDCFVAVQNRGYWFSIPESDLTSKKLFSFLAILLRLAEAGQEATGPVVTIGAGG